MGNKQTLGKIIADYTADSICMGEFLASVPADGYTMEEAFLMYIKVMAKFEGDSFYRVVEGDIQKL